MGSTVETLTALADAANRHDIPYTELLPAQIEAADERLKKHLGQIRLLAHRAEASGVGAIDKPADLVPLLFAHTAYKSYPENWLSDGKWDRMNRWLDTVSTHRVFQGVDTTGVKDVDDWLARLADAGHFVSSSSGTTGKCSMLMSSMADRMMVKRTIRASFSWTTGLAPQQDYKLIGSAPVAQNTRVLDARTAISEAFGDGQDCPFPGEPITVGQVRRMVALRRDIANGSASPSEIQAFDLLSAARQTAVEDGLATIARTLVENRHRKLIISGLFATLFQISEMVRSLGCHGNDFHRDNVLQSAGGLKGATLPANYRERILETFNIREERVFQFYSMQELNSSFPRCRAGRYHITPWVILLVLDDKGERLVEPVEGEAEGRAAFFDISLEGRWGGVITGDKITANYGQCACGHQGPTVGPEIIRFSDLPGGDKISCSGTIDAYVRGTA